MNNKYENENDSECSYPSDNMSLPSSSSSSEEEEEDNISKNIYFQPSQPMENRAVELYRSNLEELKTIHKCGWSEAHSKTPRQRGKLFSQI